MPPRPNSNQLIGHPKPKPLNPWSGRKSLILDDQLIPLTDQQRCFVDNFMIHRDARKAFNQAGYSRHTMLSAFLKDQVPVKKELQRRIKLIHDKYEVTADKIVAEYAKIAFSSVDDFTDIAADGTPVINFNKSTPESRAAIQEIRQEVYDLTTNPPFEGDTPQDEDDQPPFDAKNVKNDQSTTDQAAYRVKATKIKLWGKMEALNALAKMELLLVDRTVVEHTGIVEHLHSAKEKLAQHLAQHATRSTTQTISGELDSGGGSCSDIRLELLGSSEPDLADR